MTGAISIGSNWDSKCARRMSIALGWGAEDSASEEAAEEAEGEEEGDCLRFVRGREADGMALDARNVCMRGMGVGGGSLEIWRLGVGGLAAVVRAVGSGVTEVKLRC